jgi:hypothetical protein
LGGVGFDINEVTNAVVDEVCGQFDGTVVCIQYPSVVDSFHKFMQEPTLEAPLEHVARTRTITE